MCAVFEGQGLFHREPALDEGDFERYVQSLEPLMVIGRDVMWVLAGRTETNRVKVKRILTKNHLRMQTFHLCYNTKQMMQYGLFQRQGGIANSRSHELLFLCYKGRVPKQLAKNRLYVDAGSAVFNDVVRNVPVLPQKSHALVSRKVRETSLQAMIGVDVATEEQKDPDYEAPPAMDEEEAATAEAATATTVVTPEEASKALVTAVKRKRKLYRQLTGSEVPWSLPKALDFLLSGNSREPWIATARRQCSRTASVARARRQAAKWTWISTSMCERRHEHGAAMGLIWMCR